MFQVISAILVAVLIQLHPSNGQTTVRLTNPVIFVTEGDAFEACFELTPPPASEAILNVQSMTPDISVVNEDLTFAAGATEIQCIQSIFVVEDSLYEGTEGLENNVFAFSLSIGGASEDSVGGSLVITDATVFTARLKKSELTVVEGESVDVCVLIDGTIIVPNFNFIATLTAAPGTARSQEDFIDLPTTLQFKDSTEQQTECGVLNTNQDVVIEGPETLTLTLNATAPLQLDQSISNIITITILDADANCGRPPLGNSRLVSFPTITGPTAETSGDVFVANVGAVATYACIDPASELTGSPLMCTDNAEWSPASAPACSEPPTEPTTTDDDDVRTTREVVGVTTGRTDAVTAGAGGVVHANYKGMMAVVFTVLLATAML